MRGTAACARYRERTLARQHEQQWRCVRRGCPHRTCLRPSCRVHDSIGACLWYSMLERPPACVRLRRVGVLQRDRGQRVPRRTQNGVQVPATAAGESQQNSIKVPAAQKSAPAPWATAWHILQARHPNQQQAQSTPRHCLRFSRCVSRCIYGNQLWCAHIHAGEHR